MWLFKLFWKKKILIHSLENSFKKNLFVLLKTYLYFSEMLPDSVENQFYSTSGIFKPISEPYRSHWDLLASRRATLNDFMALSYGPARGLAYYRQRGFRAWVDCDDRHARNFCLVHCRRAALRTYKVPKNINRAFLHDRNPLKVDILLSRATNVHLIL
jgi:hypothetical protein